LIEETKLIRSALFKVFYLSELFNLNDKADASEALTKTLEFLHGLFIVS
jgi:hypothetical protein